MKHAIFDQQIDSELLPLLISYGYRVVNRFSNYIKLASNSLDLILSHDPFDRTNLIQIGDKNNNYYTIDDEVMENVFSMPDKVEQVTVDNFIHTIKRWVESTGKSLLMGDAVKIEELAAYALAKSRDYTADIIDKQLLMSIDKAWTATDYMEFIGLVEKFTLYKLPQSYALKYKIALEKIA